MKTLLIVAHGSSRKESNEEIRRLAARIHNNSKPEFSEVRSAFLELSAPCIDSAVTELIEKGASEIIVFPYFLAAGTHVVNDIPELIKEEEEKHPQIFFRILPHLGGLQGLSTLIINQVHYKTPKNPDLAALATD